MSFEDTLRQNTLTKTEVARQKQAAYEEKLRGKARKAVGLFKEHCEREAAQGNYSLKENACYFSAHGMNEFFYFSNKQLSESWLLSGNKSQWLSSTSQIDRRDAALFVRLINEELGKAGFTQARAYVGPIYKIVQIKLLLLWHDKKEKVADGVVIEASW